MNDHVKVRILDSDEAQARKLDLSEVLLDCVEGGASVSFMLPLTQSSAERFWHDVANGVARAERILIVAEDAAGAILGTVQLITHMPPNQPHRADVAKLLVRRSARGYGVGRRLMESVHEVARVQGKTLLVLDTASASAERLYLRLDWQRVGTVPDYALLPDGGLCATTFFFKRIG